MTRIPAEVGRSTEKARSLVAVFSACADVHAAHGALKEAILAAYQQGNKPRSIAEAGGVSHEYVRRIVAASLSTDVETDRRRC